MSDQVTWPQFRAWLSEHGIPIQHCYKVQVSWTAETVNSEDPVRMEVSWWRTNEQGRRYIDDSGEAASETRTIPMRRLPAVEATG